MDITTIRVIDFETTGEEPPAQVIEVGWYDVTLRAGGWAGEYQGHVSRLHGVDASPPVARAIHHISLADVAGRPPFDAGELIARARDEGIHALAAHNASFEGKWLRDFIAPVMGGMPLLCTYKAALRVWPEAPAHKNQVLRYWLEDKGIAGPIVGVTEPAHRAGPDAFVTAFLLQTLLARASVAELLAWTAEPALLPRIPIGPQKGTPWKDVEEGFLRWMVKNVTMDPDLKWNARREIERRAAPFRSGR